MSFKSQFWMCTLAIIAGCVGLARESIAQGTADDTLTEKPSALIVQLVDESGEPVANARVGFTACYGDQSFENSAWHYLPDPGTLDAAPDELLSDKDGYVSIATGLEIVRKYRVAIVARHESRELVHVSCPDSDCPARLTLTLRPECRVVGAFTSSTRTPNGEKYAFNVYLGKTLCIEHYSQLPSFDIALPPGQYVIQSDGNANGTVSRKLELTVPEHTRRLELYPIELFLSNRVQLIGQKAPELTEVIAWRSNEPDSLADLKGNVVLLDFWGYWCAGCVKKIPRLVELHEQYADQGFTVVGVHIDSQSQIDSLEKYIAYEKSLTVGLLKGTPIPYPVVLVGHNPKRHPKTNAIARCQVVLDYGIESYPTMILIDRLGNVVGQFEDNQQGLKLLESLLAKPNTQSNDL